MILAFIFFHLFFISNLNISLLSTETSITKKTSTNLIQTNLGIHSNDSLQVVSLQLVASIEDKQPSDSLDYNNIEAGQKIWAFATVSNSSQVEKEILFNWIKDNELYLSFPVKVGTAKNWRTYSYVTARKGKWQLQLKEIDSEEILEKLNFSVTK